MATQRASGIDQLTSILDLISKGSKAVKGSSSTVTESSAISQEGMDALLQKILASNQGLAAVSSGQKGAGLSNSSTNQLLINDLLTRSAGEVASQNKTATRTTVTPPDVGLGGIGAGLGAIALKSLLTEDNINSILGAGGPDYISGGINSSVAEGLGGLDAVDNGQFLGMGGTVIDNSSGAVVDATSAGASAISSGAIDAANSSGDAIQFLDDAGYFGSSAAVDSTASSADAATALSGGTVPWVASGMRVLDGDLEGAVKVGAGGYVGSAIGTAILPGIGTAVGSFLGSAIGGGCFITTAVCEYMQLADDCEILQKLRHFRDTYMQESPQRKELIVQYYREAPALVEFLYKQGEYSRVHILRNLLGAIHTAVDLIDKEDLDGALQTYKGMFHYLRSLAQISGE